MGICEEVEPWASHNDYEICRAIHRRYGTTYYFSTLRFPRAIQRRVHAVYAFVRIPDEWVDNPGSLSLPQRRQKLKEWRRELTSGLGGACPESAAMRAFCDTVKECQIPVEEPNLFLDAMEQDLSQCQYATYADLQDYMRGSACAVGVMMCAAMGVSTEGAIRTQAMALGEAMQLTNFLRDVGEDLERGRIYLPMEDMERFGVSLDDLRSGTVTPAFQELMTFEIERARELYAVADRGIVQLPAAIRPAVLLARILYSRILDRIEAQRYDVFTRRARTGFPEKAVCAAQVVLAEQRMLARLAD